MPKIHHKVTGRGGISELKAAVNDLIKIFKVEDGEKEIRKLVVTKEGKLKIDYEDKT